MQIPGPGIIRSARGDHGNMWKDYFVCFSEVEKGGMVNLDDFYMFMYQWFIKEQFTHWADDSRQVEDFYKHTIRSDGVQENLIWWRAVRKINDYIYYFCKMDWENFGSKATEIVYNDKKIKTHKIGLVVRITWWVQVDPYNKWEKSALRNIVHWFYHYLLHEEMINHMDKCREIAKRQKDEIKAFYEIPTDIQMPRSWFPEAGYKWDRPKPRPEDFEKQVRRPDYKI